MRRGGGGDGQDLREQIAEAAQRLGVSPGAATRSRRHGFRPRAKDHVERYLLCRVAGHTAGELAEEGGVSRSWARRSIKLGERLARGNARALGLVDPRRG